MRETLLNEIIKLLEMLQQTFELDSTVETENSETPTDCSWSDTLLFSQLGEYQVGFRPVGPCFISI